MVSFQYLRCLLLCALTVALCHSDLLSPRDNQLEAPTVRIDPVLRKALLKALSNLEKESDEKDATTERELFPSSSSTTTTTTESDELLEESTTADRLQGPKVHYTAFTFDGNSSSSDNGGPDDNTIYKTIIVPKTTLSPPKQSPIVVFGDPDPLKEEDIQIETVQLARSVSTSIKANDPTSETKVSDKILALSKSALTSTNAPSAAVSTNPSTSAASTTTTSTTTTTTTEAPVTNADGENIEKVNDVQIHQAPLVAAFTVQQDAQGLAKSVSPIFKQIIDPLPAPLQNQQFRQQQQQPQQQQQQGPPSNNFGLNPYQFALEAQQRELEQRIQYLQAQQRHQEQLYRQQQQQIFFEQRFRAEEEQRLRQRFEQEQQQRFRQSFQQQQQPLPLVRPQQSAGNRPPGQVQIVPSVSLQNNNFHNGLPLDQQLPIRDAGTFKISQEQQLPLVLASAVNFKPKEQSNIIGPGPLQLQSQLQLPHRSFIPFNSQSVSIVPSVSAQLKNNNIEQGLFPPFDNNQHQQLTRVFRHESQPGSSFEQQKSQSIFIPPHANAHNLQQLLFQSGVAGRSNEDLNIITRVLALNHGINAPLSGNFINQNNGGQQRNFL